MVKTSPQGCLIPAATVALMALAISTTACGPPRTPATSVPKDSPAAVSTAPDNAPASAAPQTDDAVQPQNSKACGFENYLFDEARIQDGNTFYGTEDQMRSLYANLCSTQVFATTAERTPSEEGYKVTPSGVGYAFGDFLNWCDQWSSYSTEHWVEDWEHRYKVSKTEAKQAADVMTNQGCSWPGTPHLDLSDILDAARQGAESGG